MAKRKLVIDHDGNRTNRDEVAMALAQADAAYSLLNSAWQALAHSVGLPEHPALARTASARSEVDIARAHIRELLKRMP